MLKSRRVTRSRAGGRGSGEGTSRARGVVDKHDVRVEVGKKGGHKGRPFKHAGGKLVSRSTLFYHPKHN